MEIVHKLTHTFNGNPIDEDEIKTALRTSKSLAKCYDGYSSKDLGEIEVEIIPILVIIFNHGLWFGELGSDVLRNHFFFIHKTGDINDPKNYRSISIQNPILKLLMKILNNRIMEFVETTNMLPQSQMGFRKLRNTISAAWTVKEICSKILDRVQK